MVQKLAVRGLRRGVGRGVGSMDYIHTLIMEDDLDDTNETGDMIAETKTAGATCTTVAVTVSSAEPVPSPGSPLVDCCNCGLCRPMPQAVENNCCKRSKCITTTSHFAKLCMDPDVLEMCIRNTSDIRNDRGDASTLAFKKAAYRQFILAKYGRLGKGNRRVCPSCVVLKIHEQYPSVTGVYMGYWEHRHYVRDCILATCQYR